MLTTVEASLKKAISILRKTSPSPELDAEVILSRAAKLSKAQLLARPRRKLSKKENRAFRAFFKKRAAGLPVAYITDEKEFSGRKFLVNRSVLIPRPETEELVEMVLKHLKTSKPRATSCELLDLGTGSGCIAVSLATALQATTFPSHSRRARLAFARAKRAEAVKPQPNFYASDISPAALKVARENAKRARVKIKFVQSDLFQKLPQKFDCIVANLPYVPADEYRKLKKNLRFEPRIALTDGSNTWELYSEFFRQLPQHINNGASVFLEIDPKSQRHFQTWRKKYLLGADIKFFKDLSGRIRFAVIYFQSHRRPKIDRLNN